MTNEQYIEHEVKLRLIKELNDERFKLNDEKFLEIKNVLINLENKMHSNFIFLIGLIITSMIAPIILHALKLI